MELGDVPKSCGLFLTPILFSAGSLPVTLRLALTSSTLLLSTPGKRDTGSHLPLYYIFQFEPTKLLIVLDAIY